NDGGGGRAINRDDQALPSDHIHHHQNLTLGQRLPLALPWIPASAGMTDEVTKGQGQAFFLQDLI
ncbi:MAG: hypothetical protein OXR07_03220, partial [Nitrospira sp.]|nr:hypothetical protein [Nitrospira sp.]